jgi:putative hydrolase of the HAD superfamily
MNVTAVVFDFGKVISLPQDAGFMQTLAAFAGLPAAVMEELLWSYRDEYDRGVITGEEYYRSMLASRGVRPDDALVRQMLRFDLDSWKNLNPGTLRLMEDVKAAGRKLGILSNMPADFLEFARASLPVFSRCDAAVFSCEVGSIKPEAKIYETLLSALGCPPGEVVFFDDTARNVAAAAQTGIRAFLWKDPEAARGELRGLGLDLAE